MVRKRTRTIKGKKYTKYETGRSHLLSDNKSSAMIQAKGVRTSFKGLSVRVLKGIGGTYSVYTRRK